MGTHFFLFLSMLVGEPSPKKVGKRPLLGDLVILPRKTHLQGTGPAPAEPRRSHPDLPEERTERSVQLPSFPGN